MATPHFRDRHATVTEVQVPAGDATLVGDLVLPDNAAGVVLFAHGSGSSRHSPRNRLVAEALNQAQMGTLLLDLLTSAEEREDLRTRELRFDIDLLSRRLIAAVGWLRAGPANSLAIGLFGASTGAAAALVAAAERPADVGAVVSRGGRPDLAGNALRRVRAPTLLIVGGADPDVIDLNRRALELLPAEKRLVVVPGASHLFEEPGALEQVATLAADWFSHFLGANAHRE
jgi:pimeloyl-ACP methyl ester carboxylesterase